MAHFLQRTKALATANRSGETQEQALLSKLRHRLTDNPVRSADTPLGYLVRDESATVAGVLLIAPWRFLLEDETLVGLSAGSLFLDAAARMQSFLLFRRFLGRDQCDFWFANSCNRYSAPFWTRTGAKAVASSRYEFLFPIRLGPVAEEALHQQHQAAGLASLASSLADLANPLFRLLPSSSGMTSQKSRDWEELAAISEHNRDRKFIVGERSPAYLQWRYGEIPVEEAAPSIYIFQTKTGDKGWFSIGYGRRGRNEQIGTASLLDWSLPEGLDIRRIVASSLEVARTRHMDLLVVGDRCDLPKRLSCSIRRDIGVTQAFVQSRRHDTQRIANQIVIGLADIF